MLRLSPVLVLAILACKRNPTETAPTPTDEPPTEPADSILHLLPQVRRTPIPDYDVSDPDQDGVVDALRVEWPGQVAGPAHTLVRSLAYQRQPDGTYAGSIQLVFDVLDPDAPTAHTHTERIPKSFAEHVDDLVITPPPTQIVDPDPEVLFIFDQGALQIDVDASSPIPVLDLQGDADETLASYAQQQCEALANAEDREYCLLSVVSRFPSSAVAQTLIEQTCTTNGCESVMSALTTGDWSSCETSGDTADCYTGLFALHADTGCRDAPDLSTCLLERWNTLPAGELRDRLCFDVQLQNGLAGWIDWSGFGASCLGTLADDYCDGLEDPLRARCLSARARAEGDLAACDAVGGPEAIDRCRHELFLFTTPDLAACDALTDPERQRECSYIVAVRDGHPERCLQLPPEARNHCLALTVRAHEDLSDPSICEGFVEDEDDYPDGLHDLCVLQMADRTGDIAVCDQLGSMEFRALCQLVTRDLDDAASCQQIDAPVIRCDCLMVAAAEAEDRSACLGLENPAAVTTCQQAVTEGERADPEAMLDACRNDCEDADGDGFANLLGCEYGFGMDCRDDDPAVHPDAIEVCDDGVDNDCNEALDCDDATCALDPICPTGPSTVSFLEHSGTYTVTLGFPEGQGDRVEMIPEADLGQSVYGWGELVRVWLPAMPADPAYWDGSVPVELSIADLQGNWRVYAATSPSDPAARITTSWWEPGNATIPMRGDRYYWLYIWPDVGTEKQEVIQLRGEL